MRTENEFISGVYEKYACEQEKRRKKVRTLSLCATLSACACVAVFISVRTIPALMNANAEVANDAAYVYTAAGTQEDAVEYEAAEASAYSLYSDEEILDADAPKMQTKMKSAKGENGAVQYDAKTTSEDMQDAPLMCAQTQADTAEPYGAVDYFDKESMMDVYAEAQSAKAANGSFEWAISDGIAADAYTVNGESNYERQSEYTADNGAVYGECESGYYVYFTHGDEDILLILDAEVFTLEAVKAIAESMKYIEE
ncbi:MAG: hypothetical protein IJ391_01405 [Clostridia bacterium]|nr:hypothetical protein [Clostridia bacterium]